MFSRDDGGAPGEHDGAQTSAWSGNESRGNQVSLGCGTLILIALIVLIFSGGRDNSEAIDSLREEIKTLEQKIDALSEQMKPQMPE